MEEDVGLDTYQTKLGHTSPDGSECSSEERSCSSFLVADGDANLLVPFSVRVIKPVGAAMGFSLQSMVKAFSLTRYSL